MSSLVQIHQLSRDYGQVQAVKGISFSIRQGICFGLLGPNGAGKTTTVEMLEGISQPTAGEILYKGQPLGREFRNQAGIMFQSTALQEFITVRETLALFQEFYPSTRPIDELVEVCALGDFLDRDTRKLSGGQRQRLLLAIALVNQPEILFLDEPTTGLDPQARHNFWDLVKTIKQQNKTIVLTTHYMEEAYMLCDEIAIMDHGKIIAQGTPGDLLSAHFDDVILQLPMADVPDMGLLASCDMHHQDGVVELRTSNVTETVQHLLDLGLSLEGMQVRARTLEDLFLELTGKELRP